MVFGLAGCGGGGGSSSSSDPGTVRETLAEPVLPEASGEATYSKDDGTLTLDYSHTDEGYVMIKYTGESDLLQVGITIPSGEVYPYPMVAKDSWKAFPLTGGDGHYIINVMEQTASGNYFIGLSYELDVTLNDEFRPYMYPNQYVDYDADTESVTIGKELSGESADDIDYITNVYNYVTEGIDYDLAKASNLPVNYIPDIEETLETGKGICFDFASVMTSMLRSQGIPTRLEVGYAGTVYHAWISVYLESIGWVENIIEFDGTDWTLVDPTLGSSGSAAYEDYMGSGEEYNVKYHY